MVNRPELRPVVRPPCVHQCPVTESPASTPRPANGCPWSGSKAISHRVAGGQARHERGHLRRAGQVQRPQVGGVDAVVGGGAGQPRRCGRAGHPPAAPPSRLRTACRRCRGSAWRGAPGGTPPPTGRPAAPGARRGRCRPRRRTPRRLEAAGPAVRRAAPRESIGKVAGSAWIDAWNVRFLLRGLAAQGARNGYASKVGHPPQRPHKGRAALHGDFTKTSARRGGAPGGCPFLDWIDPRYSRRRTPASPRRMPPSPAPPEGDPQRRGHTTAHRSRSPARRSHPQKGSISAGGSCVGGATPEGKARSPRWPGW